MICVAVRKRPVGFQNVFQMGKVIPDDFKRNLIPDDFNGIPDEFSEIYLPCSFAITRGILVSFFSSA